MNGHIKSQAEEALQRLDDNSAASYRIKNIFATSSLISVRMNAYDLTVNPDILLRDGRRSVKVFQKFEKVAHILNSLCRKRQINVEFLGSSYRAIDGYQFFDVLPFLIIDNAIKFSPDHQTVTIAFDETPQRLVVTVSSFGPELEEDEEETVFSKGVRGKNASQAEGGSGLGLYVAKLIADYHDVKLRTHR